MGGYMASSRGVRCIWTWGQPAREGVEVGTEAKGECPTKSLFPLKSAHVAHRTLGRSRALPPICLCGSITAQLDASACGNALIGSPSPPCRTAMNRCVQAGHANTPLTCTQRPHRLGAILTRAHTAYRHLTASPYQTIDEAEVSPMSLSTCTHLSHGCPQYLLDQLVVCHP